MNAAAENPMGTDGFEFVEYTAPEPAALGRLFETLGFAAVARHRSKRVTLYRQGDINFIVNAEPDSFAQAFARVHGPSACAMAFRVKDAGRAYARALELGARPVAGKVGPMELNIPAIEGIGGSLLYLVDRYGAKGTIYEVDFEPIAGVREEGEQIGKLLSESLTVTKDGQRITQITMEDGTIYRGKMFIDTTYEGDLMAKAGVSYMVGREANERFGETLNGIRDKTPAHQFLVPVDPYVKPGDPSSGLLPFVMNEPLGKLFGLLGRLAPRNVIRSQSRTAVAVAALMIAVYAVVGGNAAGWLSTKTLTLLAAASVLFVTFIIIEARTRDPLMPLKLFRLRNLATANVLSVLWAAGMFGWFVISALYMQYVLGYDPLRVGLAFVPADAIMAAFSAGFWNPKSENPFIQNTGSLSRSSPRTGASEFQRRTILSRSSLYSLTSSAHSSVMPATKAAPIPGPNSASPARVGQTEAYVAAWVSSSDPTAIRTKPPATTGRNERACCKSAAANRCRAGRDCRLCRSCRTRTEARRAVQPSYSLRPVEPRRDVDACRLRRVGGRQFASHLSQ